MTKTAEYIRSACGITGAAIDATPKALAERDSIYKYLVSHPEGVSIKKAAQELHITNKTFHTHLKVLTYESLLWESDNSVIGLLSEN